MEVWQKWVEHGSAELQAEVFQVKRWTCPPDFCASGNNEPFSYLSLLDAVTNKSYILYEFSVASVSTVFQDLTVRVLFCDCLLSVWFVRDAWNRDSAWLQWSQGINVKVQVFNPC